MNKMNLKILWLRERFSWMGQYSGYDQLCNIIGKQFPAKHKSVWREPDSLSLISRFLLAPMVRKANAGPFYDVHSAAAELRVLWKSFWRRPNLIHIAYVENNLGMLPRMSQRLPLKFVGTAHQPVNWWRTFHPSPESVSALDALIVPASHVATYFEQYLPGRVYYIPHGVDTEFFRPAYESGGSAVNVDNPKCIFAGRWYRDKHTLARVIKKVIAQNPKVGFDMIVSKKDRNDASLSPLAQLEQVSWYTGVSDQKLLELYQKASILVLPLVDSTTNNTILEAIACGLPIVTNDVGGIRDYTRRSFADLIPVQDTDCFVASILRLLSNPRERRARGTAARLFAEQHLTWNKIAAQTWEVYELVLPTRAKRER
jgi:glycosyltransferase involved in cell wall biosynthesis